jgi:hypothetical protein
MALFLYRVGQTAFRHRKLARSSCGFSVPGCQVLGKDRGVHQGSSGG